MNLLNKKMQNSTTDLGKYCSRNYTFGTKNFDFNKPHVMGILNITPDSFSDGGKYFNVDDAVNYALNMINEGADIIDIGGESTRPGSDPISVDEELERVIPVIEKILERKPDTTISIDTTKTKVAEHALMCGAKIVNDISGGTFEPEILCAANDYDAGFVIMHIKGIPKFMQDEPEYSNIVKEVYDFLSFQSEKAEQAGISKIFIDPGIGFGKRVEDNFDLIRSLGEFKNLTYPILIGVSRKSFIGKTFNLNINERDDVSNVLNFYAMSEGARIIRTHDVKLAAQTCKLAIELIVN